jgi:hypothetical protein
MESAVNVGRMRDLVKLYYQVGEVADTQGSRKPTFCEYTVWADVVPMSFDKVQRYGLNFVDANYEVTCRPPTTGRLGLVIFNEQEYSVINPVPDKYGRFIKFIIKRKT